MNTEEEGRHSNMILQAAMTKKVSEHPINKDFNFMSQKALLIRILACFLSNFDPKIRMCTKMYPKIWQHS